jgi:hypothetical protein
MEIIFKRVSPDLIPAEPGGLADRAYGFFTFLGREEFYLILMRRCIGAWTPV